MNACVAILADVHRTGGYPAHWPADPHHWLTPSRHITAWVAERDGGVVGHVSLTSADGEAAAEHWSARTGRPVTDTVAVSRLYVARHARGRAVGRRLLDEATAAARDRGRHPVLSVLDHNRNAIALYEKAGWEYLSEADLTLPDGRVVLMHCFSAPER
jgi:GNAT superfamily N-acetyltransferase